MDRDRLRACSSEDVVRSSIEIAARLSATQAALLDMIAVIDERQLWRADGCLSVEDWVSFTYQVSRRTAHEWVEAARALEGLPNLSDAFASGELSWDKTRAVSMLATPESDATLTDEARQTDVKHLERGARRARAASLEDANSRHRDRFFAMRRSITMGGVRLSGFLPDVDGETLIKAIERLADDVPKDPETGLYPRYDARCADALVDIAAGSLSREQPTHGERSMVVTHVEVSGDSMTAETESGITLARQTAERLMCDSVAELVLERDGEGVISDASGVDGTGGAGASEDRAGKGRPAKNPRFPNRRMRRRLVHRDQGCRFNGCCRTRLLHAHHIKHWPGGPTEDYNLVMLCRYHHRLVHEGGWMIRGDPDGLLEFVKPGDDP